MTFSPKIALGKLYADGRIEVLYLDTLLPLNLTSNFSLWPQGKIP